MKIYIVSGFLGSGKTTAIANAAKLLSAEGLKIAVITNDQGSRQVDANYMKAFSFPTTQISNGCFCCRFDEFEKVVLSIEAAEQPEVIFAEAVGSCADLVATVIKPLAKRNPQIKSVVSTFADAKFLHEIFSGSATFVDPGLLYLYKKQLEEADVIALNKRDLLDQPEMAGVAKMVSETYPSKEIVTMSALGSSDIHNWLKLLENFGNTTAQNIEIDYDLYGKAETTFAWLDRQMSIHTRQPVAVETALTLIKNIMGKIGHGQSFTGHLKFMLSTGNWHSKISYTTGSPAPYPLPAPPSVNHVDLLINARVQTSPEELALAVEKAIERTMQACPFRQYTYHVEAFRPGFPTPQQRIV